MSKAAKSGGGPGMNKNVSPGIRTGAANRGSSAGAADQIGQAVAFKKDQVDGGRAFNASQLGNAKALDVQGGGPGKGREVFRSGSQGTHGNVAGASRPMGRDILSQFGPEKRKG